MAKSKEFKSKKNNPKKHRKLPAYINEAEFVKLLANGISQHHKISYLLAFQSGLRISEVMNLRPEHFRFETNEIKIIDGKGSKDRWVPLPRDWCENFIDFIPIKCSVRALQTAFYSARDRAGLTKALHFHSLRHSYATHLHGKGCKIEKISKSMGHEDVSTTMIYTHMNPKKMLNELRREF